MDDKTLHQRMTETINMWYEDEDYDEWWIYQRDYLEARNTIEAQATRIEALEARLEIEPSHSYDGIDARDETIRLLEQRIEALETEKRKLALDLLAALGQAADALESKP